jgi:hypothetical protein
MIIRKLVGCCTPFRLKRRTGGWCSGVGHQVRALFKPLFFKVLLSIENISAHIWLVAIAQTIVRFSCLIFDVSPASSDGSYMSQFLAAAWVIHSDFILNEVGCVGPEPIEPFIKGQPLLFIHASELIHAKRRILEIRNFPPLEDSSDDGADSGSSDSLGGEGMPGPGGGGSMWPWLVIFCFVGTTSSSRQPWPSLPRHGGDIQWGQQALPASHADLASRMDPVASQCGKATAARKPTTRSRMPWAQASRRCGKVIEKATRCALSRIYRQLPSATLQGSNQSPVPEVKFKRCSMHKTAKPRVVLQLDNPTIEHQWGAPGGRTVRWWRRIGYGPVDRCHAFPGRRTRCCSRTR